MATPIKSDSLSPSGMDLSSGIPSYEEFGKSIFLENFTTARLQLCVTCAWFFVGRSA